MKLAASPDAVVLVFAVFLAFPHLLNLFRRCIFSVGKFRAFFFVFVHDSDKSAVRSAWPLLMRLGVRVAGNRSSKSAISINQKGTSKKKEQICSMASNLRRAHF